MNPSPKSGFQVLGEQLRVLLADDHALVRKSLQAMLVAAGVDVCAEAANGQDALAAIRRLAPAVAILDIEMPGLTGIEVARKLRDEGSTTKVLLLSVHKEVSFVRAAIEAGVLGYVVKDDAPEDLLLALRAAALGQVYLSPRSFPLVRVDD